MTLFCSLDKLAKISHDSCSKFYEVECGSAGKIKAKEMTYERVQDVFYSCLGLASMSGTYRVINNFEVLETSFFGQSRTFIITNPGLFSESFSAYVSKKSNRLMTFSRSIVRNKLLTNKVTYQLKLT